MFPWEPRHHVSLGTRIMVTAPGQLFPRVGLYAKGAFLPAQSQSSLLSHAASSVEGTALLGLGHRVKAIVLGVSSNRIQEPQGWGNWSAS
jgi:hypothetical protein